MSVILYKQYIKKFLTIYSINLILLSKFMIFIRLFIFLTIVLLINTISCQDQHCVRCSSSVRNNITYRECDICQYPWHMGDTSCIRSPSCNAAFCQQCDPIGKYCIKCNKYYTLGIYKCQLKSYMVGIISTACSLIVIVVSIIFIRHYCKRIRIGGNDQSNQNLDSNQQNLRNMNGIRSDSNLYFNDVQNNIQNEHDRNLKKINRDRKRKELIKFVYKLPINQIIPCQDACTICLQDNCNVITQCNHYFHLLCLVCWVQKRNHCPLCNIRLNQEIKIISCDNCRDQYETYNLQELNYEDLKMQNRKLLCPVCIDKNKSKLIEMIDISPLKKEQQAIQ